MAKHSKLLLQTDVTVLKAKSATPEKHKDCYESTCKPIESQTCQHPPNIKVCRLAKCNANRI
jgi:hypothetical protein